MKRILLFLATNLLVMVTISFLTSLLGIQPYLTSNGINHSALMQVCLLWGMAGAFISLALSRIMAKFAMGVQLVDKQPEYAWLVSMVDQIRRKAQLSTMPEVGVFQSPEPNAFATGPTKSRALVAVSTGLLQRMDKREVEAVLAHEVAHIANGDMVTMTLLQGVVNAFVMFFARAISFALSQNVKEESRALVRMVTTMVLEIAFAFLGMIIVAWFSRKREYRADAGAARYASKEGMIAALQALKRNSSLVVEKGNEPQAIQALKISGHSGGFWSLFSTHPALDDRIAALEKPSYRS